MNSTSNTTKKCTSLKRDDMTYRALALVSLKWKKINYSRNGFTAWYVTLMSTSSLYLDNSMVLILITDLKFLSIVLYDDYQIKWIRFMKWMMGCLTCSLFSSSSRSLGVGSCCIKEVNSKRTVYIDYMATIPISPNCILGKKYCIKTFQIDSSKMRQLLRFDKNPYSHKETSNRLTKNQHLLQKTWSLTWNHCFSILDLTFYLSLSCFPFFLILQI